MVLVFLASGSLLTAYAMLRSAKAKQERGVDLVIGYVETHGRKDTEALLAGFELLPRREIKYKGTLLTELDLEAVVARKPQLAAPCKCEHALHLKDRAHASRCVRTESRKVVICLK